MQSVAAGGDYSIAVGGAENYVVEKKPEPVVEPASSGSGWAPPAVTPDPGSAQAYAAGAVAARGWASSEFDCLVALWNKESGWRVNAYNASSGAYGIPAGASGLEDGHGGRRLGDQRRHADRMGPRVHLGPLRHALRRLGALAVRRLVLSARLAPSGASPARRLVTWRARTDPGVGRPVHARGIPNSMSTG